MIAQDSVLHFCRDRIAISLLPQRRTGMSQEEIRVAQFEYRIIVNCEVTNCQFPRPWNRKPVILEIKLVLPLFVLMCACALAQTGYRREGLLLRLGFNY